MSAAPGVATVADTLVVIPTYCEAANIVPLIEQVLAALDCQVLVVDDGSPDGTAEALRQGFAGRRRVSLLDRSAHRRGLGPAYRDGFAWALERPFRLVVQMDGDFSHPPSRLPELVAASREADLVVGSRYVAGGSAPGLGPGRALLSRAGSLYARLLLGLPLKDVTGGFKCWRAEALARLDPARVAADGFAFQIEMNWRAHRLGMRIVEVPIDFGPRRHGGSKMSGRIVMEGLRAVWRLRGRRP